MELRWPKFSKYIQFKSMQRDFLIQLTAQNQELQLELERVNKQGTEYVAYLQTVIIWCLLSFIYIFFNRNLNKLRLKKLLRKLR